MIYFVMCDRCHRKIQPEKVEKRLLYREVSKPAAIAHIGGFTTGDTVSYIDLCRDCARDFEEFMDEFKGSFA